MNRIDDDASAVREMLSVYMDGELPVEQRDGLLHQVKADGAVRTDWVVYHCIGDVLRSDDTAYLSPSFALQLRNRLDAEPFLFAPEVAKTYAAQQAPPSLQWRWPVAATASAMLVLAVGSMVMPQHGTEMPQPPQSAHVSLIQAPSIPTGVPTVAAVLPAPAAPMSATAPGIRAVSNEYLMAHRHYSTGLAMHGVVSHVRTAGYDGK